MPGPFGVCRRGTGVGVLRRVEPAVQVGRGVAALGQQFAQDAGELWAGEARQLFPPSPAGG